MNNYALIVADLGRNPGGGHTEQHQYCEKTFYSVSFNPNHPILVYKKTNPMTFLGGISVAVGVLAHELSHLYELAIQKEDNIALGYDTKPVSLDSLGYIDNAKWFTITIKIIPYVKVTLGGITFQFTVETWDNHKDSVNSSWVESSAIELFTQKNIIIVSGYTLSQYIKWAENANVKADLEIIAKNFPSWVEYYAVSMQDKFSSGLDKETAQQTYLPNSENTLEIYYAPTKLPLSQNEPTYIPLSHDK